MQKVYKSFMISLILMLGLVFAAPVMAHSHPDLEPSTTNIQLTEKQKNELASQYKDILKREQKIIATYVKYGVITEKQGKIVSSHLEKRYNKLEESGFLPHWGKHKGKDEHKHEKK